MKALHLWKALSLFENVSVLCPQRPLSSQWCAPMNPSFTSSSSTLSQSSASSSSPCCWCATRAAATARAKRARTAPPSCGLKNLTSVTRPPVWTHPRSAYTPAPSTKRGPLLPMPRAHCGFQPTQCQGADLDSTFRPYCRSLLCWISQSVSYPGGCLFYVNNGVCFGVCVGVGVCVCVD